MTSKSSAAARRPPAKTAAGRQRAKPAGTVLRGGAPAQERELRAQGRETMQRLLDAGRYVFERRGFHASRVDDVVKRAKMSHGTFYLYFSNKEDLFRALARTAMDDMAGLAGALPAIPADAAGLAALRDWIDSFFEVYARHGTVIRAWTEGEIVDNELGRQGSDLLVQLSSAITARIEEAEPGADADPRIAGLACMSMLERFSYLVQSRQIAFDREVMIDTVASVAHAGFFAAGRQRTRRRSTSAR